MAALDEWESHERHYTLTESTFIKRELYLHELPRSFASGQPVVPKWSKERLLNEAASLRFIASKTTIPVPKVVDLYEHDGLLHLETTRAKGITLDEIKTSHASLALSNVKKSLISSILPQMRNLRRNTVGGVDEDQPFFPPSRITSRDKREVWWRKSLNRAEFVFCHNDLGQHNILVDPKTFEISAIIDWEFSGFYPVEFELPLWETKWNDPHRTDGGDEITDHHIALLEDQASDSE